MGLVARRGVTRVPLEHQENIMNARWKFVAAGALVLGTVGYLMASGIKETGVYYLTPTELSQKIQSDRSIYDVGMKIGAKVVRGSVQHDVASQTYTFRVTDGAASYPVTYRGLAPDTFSDSAEVVVEGRLQRDGSFRATTLLAKCGSRFEAAPPQQKSA
jgi:cytochrome c-type biogenesis protein CcmE